MMPAEADWPVQNFFKQKAKYCCMMRAKFLTGIVAQVPDHMMATPTEAADFMIWDRKNEDGLSLLRPKYCPFCGKRLEFPEDVP